METSIKTQAIINKSRRVMRNAFIITILMIAAAIITGYSNVDGKDGGYALIFLFGFTAMTSLIVALLYRPRAKDFDKLVNDMKPLAHWTYDKKEWEAFIQEDLEETIVMNKSKLKYIAFISLVVLAFLLLIYQDVFFIWVIAGLIALLSLVAFIAPRIRSAMLKKGTHEAIIGEHAAYVGGLFQTWTRLGARLTGVDIYPEGEIPILNIIFEVPTLQTYQQEIVRIPIPAGNMDKAKEVVELLRKKIR